MVVKKTIGIASGLGTLVLTTMVLVALGLVYFLVSLWIIKTGAHLLGYNDLEANWAVLSAALLSVGSLVGKRA
ncbi:MAG: hypothetical protein V1787_00230 [Candidatus Micrarchaeota archaeon]